MQHDALALPEPAALKRHALEALRRYWPRELARIEALPVAQRACDGVRGPLDLVDVRLPDWAVDAGVDGCLAVPREACGGDDSAPDWAEVDWWLAAFLMLEGWHERIWESAHGSIHSYSVVLRGASPRLWERAWVNRIALFLRVWAAMRSGVEVETLFGPLPSCRIELTHDVDAVEKTLAIRLKQTAFLVFNALRSTARGRFRDAGLRLAAARRFLFGRSDWWMLDAVRDAERRAGLRSSFNFYADDRAKGLSAWLFDPGYDVGEARLHQFIASLAGSGWSVGLHQSYDAWRSPALMRRQKERLQACVAMPVESCRQHWLRFSWRDTWAAQQEAGLKRDTTLMFNDRPGLRTGAALRWSPWNPRTRSAHALTVTPTVLMDSHFYDYRPMAAEERRSALDRWLAELVAVGGEAAVLWHPHTLTPDYGWRDGFDELLARLPKIAGAAA